MKQLTVTQSRNDLILWNVEVCYCAGKRSKTERCPDPSQIQSNPSYWHSQKTHFNICHPSMQWVLKWPLHLSYSNQNFVRFSHLPQTSDHVLSISSLTI